MFKDSEIATKFSSGRTKSTALVKNVLAPHSVQVAVAAVENTSSYGVATDASNHGSQKIFPLVVQYFCKDKGIQSKILKVDSLPNETSDTIAQFCSDTLKALNIPGTNCR